MSPSSENSANSIKFQPLADPVILEPILAQRLPISCNVYNIMKLNSTWQNDIKWFTLQDPNVHDVWIAATYFRKDLGRVICISRPPTAQNSPEVRHAFLTCDFIDWDESFLFTAVDTTVSSLVADISIIDKGNWTQVHPNDLYLISREDAANLKIETGEFELKPINNKEGVDFIGTNWKYANENTPDYVEKSLSRGISSGVYINGKIVAGALVTPDGLTGMLYCLKEFRGKGYGRIVMNQVMKEGAESQHIPCCCVEVRNEVSKAFQVKIGFKLAARVNYVKYVKSTY
ncbi:unnamed protein product [Allacma fusca]|uniref:N-acetyltransferase domain-containing protein n=1 Tax=Allacma fusca TaxID=39272 RepID=A0A8J2KCL0_9HEXA|nr:unnamed protein product [Allacma fusca]